MVKRLRHHPFTVVSRVRIPVGSPDKPLRLTEEARPKSAKYHRTKSEDFKTCSAFRKYSSVGRASALQAGGHRFEPCYFHQNFKKTKCLRGAVTIIIC